MPLDGLAAFDDGLTGRQDHCTSCGVGVDPDVICGQFVPLDACPVEVFCVFCPGCARHWRQHADALMRVLRARYR